ncbi:hypothetical protein NL676_034594 [Syzygium grande]|nr:hypothetical protein NL676_034594 [Syzygium grande]
MPPTITTGGAAAAAAGAAPAQSSTGARPCPTSAGTCSSTSTPRTARPAAAETAAVISRWRRAAASDPLLARRCANCDTTSTPLWRNGPRGPKSLCNACGIRFKKEERRATAAAASGGGGVAEAQHVYGHQWVHQAQAASQKVPPCFSPAAISGHHHHEFRFMEDDVVASAQDSSDGGISFLSWCLNVTDRPSLVHDFTR